MGKISDREYVLRTLQDLRVKLRDEVDFMERKKLKKIIKQFEQGFIEEYGNYN